MITYKTASQEAAFYYYFSSKLAQKNKLKIFKIFLKNILTLNIWLCYNKYCLQQKQEDIKYIEK